MLKLPSTLRQRIFVLAGLPSLCEIDLAFDTKKRLAPSVQPDPDHVWRFLLPPSEHPEPQIMELAQGRRTEQVNTYLIALRLMLTCRAFYNDVCLTLCTTCHVFICITTGGGARLDRLARLSSSFIANLQRLTVQLRVSTGDDDCCGEFAATKLDSTPKPPLSIEVDEDADLIRAWLKAWQVVEQELRTTPSPKLNLRLICECHDAATAREVLRPLLHNSRPILKYCTVRLGRRHCSELMAIAQSAVMTATTGPPKQAQDRPFPFFDLPAELRAKILAYTALVVPEKQIEWRPGHALAIPWNRTRPQTLKHMAQHSDVQNAEECNSTSCVLRPNRLGCFCQAIHSSYTNEPALQCGSCCHSPMPLLLTSRRMREEAVPIFFGLNTFIIAPEGGWDFHWGFLSEGSNRLPAASFLSHCCSTGSARFLRSIKIVIPGFATLAPDVCATDTPMGNDWISTVAAARETLNLSMLTITIIFLRWGDHQDQHGLMEQSPEFNGEACLTYYANIVRPLHVLRRGLDRLKSFFVYLPWFAWHPDDWFSDNRSQKEAMLEGLVMGDDYDATLAGKEPLPVALLNLYTPHKPYTPLPA